MTLELRKMDSESWEVTGPRDFPALFRALDGWLGDDCVLYFEGGRPDAEIKAFLETVATPEQRRLPLGTLWPRPLAFHAPASHAVLKRLAEIMERHAEPELAVHFHVYRGEDVLLEWYDAFSDPFRVSSSVPADQIEVLARRLGTTFRRQPSA